MRALAVLSILLILPISVTIGGGEPVVGEQVPSFNLPYATKDSVSFDGYGSKDLSGKTYILAFFPAAWSSGCTKEVCTFRDEFSDFEKLGVEVLPVSGDYVFTLHEWAKYHNLPFKLLADHTREFGRAMGVYDPERGMFQRSVFVVGPDGVISYVDRQYSVADNADFEALKKNLAKSKKQAGE